MKIPAIAATLVAALWFLADAALSCDDHDGVCEIKDWNHTYISIMETIRIEGVTTCDTGGITLRLYDGEGEDREFIGIERAYIKGHAFRTQKLEAAMPAALSIQYGVEPM